MDQLINDLNRYIDQLKREVDEHGKQMERAAAMCADSTWTKLNAMRGAKSKIIRELEVIARGR